VSDPTNVRRQGSIEPVHADAEARTNVWTNRLVLFLRIMAGVSMVTGLYHWAEVTGIIAGVGGTFEMRSTAWQAATIYFAVIDLVAAVGLWLAAAWGAVVWLTAVVSMAAVELLFPQVYGRSILVVMLELVLVAAYLVLAVLAARERPP
jgi:Family of unknown function (DUF6163)